jgi:hypothetical protein
VPLSHDFMSLVAVMDWHSRRVLSWRLSNSLSADFCCEALQEALARHGRPEIFNTDPGAQFTKPQEAVVSSRNLAFRLALVSMYLARLSSARSPRLGATTPLAPSALASRIQPDMDS